MTFVTHEQLEQLAGGQLSGTLGESLSAHVAECSDCAGRLDECRADLALAADIEEAFPDPLSSFGELDAKRHSRSAPAHLDDRRPAQSRPASTTPADSIPGYEIVREIHRGGQGVVYEAIQLSTKRTVAVKVMLEGPFAGERSRWRFEREVKLIARLKHPNIVVIHDSGIGQGRYYFAMDYICGQPLDTHTRLAKLSVRDIVRLFVGVCDAVSYAHRHGIIHRDLKPSNIIVDENGEPQVLDFGLAKITGDEMRESQVGLATQVGQLMGTLRYMSPEQTMGDPVAIDTRTDVYTLGVILYELLARSTPYPTDVDLSEALNNIRETDPLRLSRIRRGISSELDAIVLKAMHKEQDRRYQSAGEMQQDLVAWLEGRPVTAKADSAFYVLRKLAARHYFHTSVIVALIATIIGFTGVSYSYSLDARAALEQKLLSDDSAHIAHKDMARFVEDGRTAVRRQVLGWFLLEWHKDRLDRARAIQAQLKSTESNEYAAMAFLLDENVTVEQLREQLPESAGVLLHFAVGERHLKAGRTAEAMAAFELSIARAGAQYEWFRQSAAARLDQLRLPAARMTKGLP